MDEQQIDTGDTVFHEPTGETWLVACVQDDRVSWVGWPEGSGLLSDCTLKQKATPGKRQELLEKLAAINESDHRQRYAAHRLKQSEPDRPSGIHPTHGQLRIERGELGE
jgi:hypothetical protein